ncbi:uncharacterized protein M437DRAFT_49717 [Aureobasidium melanogenum CBS 110374]|uniref:Uncharacterized protein n=1 Tax=Aureobasidium melanogenum (strain CBS 110374) TaxID=1043003 RepID=A0A074WJK8_AURM1|nr:uncharacterized protein M437DRAFT_49717 [Aureobasidium melanogenum CBS 110374]KEQ62596.1 hypothetical protein M437DRAFT_49717 [Aureobasidium melanogenum CBS 110374]
MAEARNAQKDEDDKPPYPTFMERWIENSRAPRFAAAFGRLIWPIQGEFPSTISVMAEPHQDTGTLQPLFDSETGEWHKIASQSITDSKVSYIEASVVNLDNWDRRWERLHMEHADPAYDECKFVTYGDLDNGIRPFAEDPEREDGTWSWDERSDTEILVHCCDEDRPLDKQYLTLKVRPSLGNDFVTVKDYVGAVHSWLMSMQDDILAAMQIVEVLLEEPEYSPTAKWMLSNSEYDAPRHRIIHPKEWESRNRPPSQIKW